MNNGDTWVDSDLRLQGPVPGLQSRQPVLCSQSRCRSGPYWSRLGLAQMSSCNQDALRFLQATGGVSWESPDVHADTATDWQITFELYIIGFVCMDLCFV
jgi:hypothetical protein